MIIAPLDDAGMAAALRRAARPDEDVVWRAPQVREALARGFCRLLVRVTDRPGAPSASPATVFGPPDVPELILTGQILDRWERDRRGETVPRPRPDFLSERLRVLIRDHALAETWVDRALGEIARASGGPLPRPFTGLARRVLELPSHYTDLAPLEELTGIGRDALTARFRRRGLDSPTVWIRRFRVVAAAHLLSDPTITTLDAAHRLGFGGSGNFCRLVRDAGGVSPTALRRSAERRGLHIRIGGMVGDDGMRERWSSLGALFVEEAA